MERTLADWLSLANYLQMTGAKDIASNLLISIQEHAIGETPLPRVDLLRDRAPDAKELVAAARGLLTLGDEVPPEDVALLLDLAFDWPQEVA